MTSMPGYGVGAGNYGTEGAGRERGGRRKRLAALANNVYKAGSVAVNEIRESYNQTRARDMDSAEVSRITIPGSFPEVAIVTKGHEQMVLFPSYAKRHVREKPSQHASAGGPPPPASVGMNEQDYWRQEWARHEDEKAVVDVDVRGWLYNPHRGPITRRNRILLGLARQLSGIPVPRPPQSDGAFNNSHEQHEEERERQSIAREAREIERRGRAEEAAAQKGAYSERPKDEDSEDEGDIRRHNDSGTSSPRTTPPSPTSPPLIGRTNTSSSFAASEAELAVANTNLMARISPFMTTPLIDVPITLFFYNDSQSQSRTVATDEAGHFVTRVALDFVPTHVKVLVNQDISFTEPVKLIEPRGISLISDIDDTIKRSNISMGAKEIFRNTFVRELKDLTIEGVKEWYNELHKLGVRIHYCSNSPWQLFPVLATYFKIAGLPPGSLHLKKYSGMLQGIFEPVAERKKGTLTKIMNDFPERRFLLVGDSGEADLEVYTELALAYPGRIVAIFIRDVTTPEQAGYFDSAFDSNDRQPTLVRRRQNLRNNTCDDQSVQPPALPPRSVSTSKVEEPLMGDLIDLSDEPLPIQRTTSGIEELSLGSNVSRTSRKPPPPKPMKPAALKSLATTTSTSSTPPPPPPPRRVTPGTEVSARGAPHHPLSQIHNSSEQRIESPYANSSTSTSRSSTRPTDSSSSLKTNILPPPPPPRRRGTPKSLSPRLLGNTRPPTSNADIDFDPLPVPSMGGASGGASGASSGTTSPGAGGGQAGPLNKKLELWKRRLIRAHEILGQQGVPLYTWRRGEDVIMEAVGLVKEFLEKENQNRCGGRR